MKLQQDAFDQMFKQYRAHLRTEIHRFCDCVSVSRQINDRTKDHLAELNLAPAFFQTVEGALFTTIVLWADKLLDESGERGLFNFLTFVEYNRAWLTPKELQRRRAYPDGHWMLQDRVPITPASVEDDRQKIRSLSALASIRIRRDKFHGHFDKNYFFDRERLKNDAPLRWEELDEAAEVMGSIINDYSVDFDGNMFSWKTMNVADLGALLNVAAAGNRR